MNFEPTISDTKAYNAKHLDLLANNNKESLKLLPELLFKILFNNQNPIDKSVPLVCKAVNDLNVEGLKKYIKSTILDALPPLETANESEIYEGASINKKLTIEKKSINTLSQTIQQLQQEFRSLVLSFPSQAPIMGVMGAIYLTTKSVYHFFEHQQQAYLFRIIKIIDDQGGQEYKVYFEATSVENDSLSSWQIQAIQEAVSIRNQEWKTTKASRMVE